MIKMSCFFLTILLFASMALPCCLAEELDETSPVLADLGFTFDEFARRSTHGVTYAIDSRNLEKLIVDKSRASQDMQSKVITIMFENATVSCALSTNPLSGNISSIQILSMYSHELSPKSIMEWLFTVTIPCPSDGKKPREIEDEKIMNDTRQWMSIRSDVVSACAGIYDVPVSLNTFYVVNGIVFTIMKVDTVFIFNAAPVTIVETE